MPTLVLQVDEISLCNAIWNKRTSYDGYASQESKPWNDSYPPLTEEQINNLLLFGYEATESE